MPRWQLNAWLLGGGLGLSFFYEPVGALDLRDRLIVWFLGYIVLGAGAVLGILYSSANEGGAPESKVDQWLAVILQVAGVLAIGGLMTFAGIVGVIGAFKVITTPPLTLGAIVVALLTFLFMAPMALLPIVLLITLRKSRTPLARK
jgi:hypothetical protein